jgi:hypothetical protein
MSDTVEKKEYASVLDRLTAGRALPDGCDKWAMRTVRPDLTSRNNYRYPFPGNWAEASGPFVPDSKSECPSVPGDGICAATDYRGMASGGVPARTLLLVAYNSDDLLGFSSHKLRLRRMFVVELLDGEKVLQEHGSGANLSGADLRGAHLSGADLRGANLSGANLSGAYLSGAYLRGAYLSGAYLRGAYLSGAYLSGAYLSGAYLSGADLRGAHLSGANLRGANLGGWTRGADGYAVRV